MHCWSGVEAGYIYQDIVYSDESRTILDPDPSRKYENKNDDISAARRL